MSDDRLAGLGIAGLRRQQERFETSRRWRLRVAPLLLIGLAGLAAFENRAGPLPGLSGRSLLVSAGLIVFAVACLGVQATARRSRPAYMAFSTAVIAGSAVLMAAQPTGPGSVCAFIGVLLTAMRLPGRAALGLSATAFVVLTVINQVIGADAPGQAAPMVAFGGFFGMIYLADRLADANGQAGHLLAKLELSQAAAAEAAGLAERQRLAREMHDVLAHSLSGLMLQLEAARMLTQDDPGDPRLPGAIDRAHHLAKSGLEEARRAIGMLRGDDLPGPERLARLAEEFREHYGIPCQLTVEGEEHMLSSQARLALYRVAQEALTNITKHAGPGRVELHLAYQPDATRLTVENFTSVSSTLAAPADGHGYGLTGMRERAELLGGTLNTGPTANGFRVELEVPR